MLATFCNKKSKKDTLENSFQIKSKKDDTQKKIENERYGEKNSTMKKIDLDKY
jgi:hypothetical protein